VVSNLDQILNSNSDDSNNNNSSSGEVHSALMSHNQQPSSSESNKSSNHSSKHSSSQQQQQQEARPQQQPGEDTSQEEDSDSVAMRAREYAAQRHHSSSSSFEYSGDPNFLPSSAANEPTRSARKVDLYADSEDDVDEDDLDVGSIEEEGDEDQEDAPLSSIQTKKKRPKVTSSTAVAIVQNADDVSSVGSFAPTLASRQSATNDSYTAKKKIKSRHSQGSNEEDLDNPMAVEIHSSNRSMASSLGSQAPTLTTTTSSRAGSTTSTQLQNKYIQVQKKKKPAAAKTKNAQETHGHDEDDISSVGSFAPTLSSQRSRESWRGKSIEAKIKRKPRRRVLGYYNTGDTGNDSDDAVSSVGSGAPTVASRRSSRSTSTSVVLENRSLNLVREDQEYLQEQLNHQDDEDEEEEVSLLESRSPSLSSSPSKRNSKNRKKLKKQSSSSSSPLVSPSYLAPSGPLASSSQGKRDSPRKTQRRQKEVEYEQSDQDGDEQGSEERKDLFQAVDDESSGVSFHQYASDMALLGGVLGREDLAASTALEDIVGSFLRRGAVAGALLWLFLLGLMMVVAPLSSYQYMNVHEQMANMILLTLLIGVNMNRLGPFLVNDARYDWNFLLSGPMTASVVVQFISIATVIMMLFLPTPIIIDPITGMRCHLVRWAAWTSMAFLMTFLTESIDLPLEDGSTRTSWVMGTALAVSTLCGAIMPFSPNEHVWLAVFFASCALFSLLYIRLVYKAWRLRATPKGHTTADKENYERARFAVKLMGICAFLWTTLIGGWITCAIGSRFAGPNSFWASDWIVLAVENTCEAMSKIGYLSILIEVHEQLFDEVSRTARRLGDLRKYMSAVWDASNDVVIICSSHDSMVNAAVSPSFFQMEHAFDDSTKKPKKKRSIYEDVDQSKTTLVMEVDPYAGSYRTFEVDLSKKMSREEANTVMKTSRNKARMVTPVFNKNLKVLSDLVCDACTVAFPEDQNQNIMLKDFYCENTDDRNRLRKLHCEAKVVKLQGKTFLIVLRDVTQRVLQHRRRGHGKHVEGDAASIASCASSDTDRTGNQSLANIPNLYADDEFRHEENEAPSSPGHDEVSRKDSKDSRDSRDSSHAHSLYSDDESDGQSNPSRNRRKRTDDAALPSKQDKQHSRDGDRYESEALKKAADDGLTSKLKPKPEEFDSVERKSRSSTNEEQDQRVVDSTGANTPNSTRRVARDAATPPASNRGTRGIPLTNPELPFPVKPEADQTQMHANAIMDSRVRGSVDAHLTDVGLGKEYEEDSYDNQEGPQCFPVQPPPACPIM